MPGRDGRSLPALAASPRWVCLVSHGGSRRFHVSCAEGPHDCIYFLPNAQDRTISLHLLLPGNAAATSPTHTAKQICEPPPPHQQHPFDHTLPRGPPITAQRPFVIGSSHAPGFGLCWSRPLRSPLDRLSAAPFALEGPPPWVTARTVGGHPCSPPPFFCAFGRGFWGGRAASIPPAPSPSRCDSPTTCRRACGHGVRAGTASPSPIYVPDWPLCCSFCRRRLSEVSSCTLAAACWWPCPHLCLTVLECSPFVRCSPHSCVYPPLCYPLWRVSLCGVDVWYAWPPLSLFPCGYPRSLRV